MIMMENKNLKNESDVDAPNWNKLMAILNSRFLIWVLGAVFLSILPIIIKGTRLSYDNEKRISLKKEMLEVEIYHRIKHIEKLGKPVNTVQLNDALFAFYGLDDSLVKQRHWRYYNFKPIYSAFERTPFRNLVIEFSTVQSDDDAIRRTKDISHLMDKMKHRYLIVDFEEVKISINNKSFYDIRLFAKDSAELNAVFLNPITDWSNSIDSN